MFVLYNLTFLIFAIIYLPYLLFRKKLHRGFIQRLGFLPSNLDLDSPIWIHAVSVGEARIAQILVKQLRQIYPKKRFLFSTITPTGNRIIRGFLHNQDLLIFLPFDLSFITNRAIRMLRPCVCIIVETEIWPNLITSLYKMNVPVILVNARISDSSFLGYRIIKPLIKSVFNKISLFCIRNNQDARRLSALGVDSKRLSITGNMKYDIIDLEQGKIDYTDYRLILGLKQQEQLFVAGSTNPGEEEIIINIYKRLINKFTNLKLFIAPRHPERAKEVARIAARFGLKATFVSTQEGRQSLKGSYQTQPRVEGDADHKTIFILDVIGRLLSFYAIADIVFVGGSLVKKGGQNILEPAIFGKPIIFGPYMFNFHDISDLFLTKAAACMVHSQDELSWKISSLLNNPDESKRMGMKARQLVLDNQGATIRNVERISSFISHG